MPPYQVFLPSGGSGPALRACFVAKLSSGRREEAVEWHACRGLVEEGLVGGVLQEAADEVGHARDEVADRAVGADAEALGRERVLEVVAEAAEDLELEVAVRGAGRAVGGDGVGDGAQVVRRDGDAERRAR